MLFWEGEPCAGVFLIGQGTVKTFKTSASGHETMLALERHPRPSGINKKAGVAELSLPL